MMRPLILLLLPLACLAACKPKVDDPRPGGGTSTETTKPEVYRDTRPGNISASILATDGYMVGCGTDAQGKVMIAKFSTTGSVLWTKTYNENETGVLTGIVETLDGKYAVCGTVVSDSGDYDTRVTVVDAGGNMQWQKTVGGLKDETHPRIGIFSNWGTIITVSAVEAVGGEDLVLHFVPEHHHTSAEVFEAPGHQIPYSIAPVTANSSTKTVSITGSSHATVAAPGRMMTAVYSWEKPVNSESLDGGHVISRHVIALSDNKLMSCGSTSSGGKCKGFIAKTDEKGALVWHKTYSTDENMRFTCVASDVNGFVAAGHIYSSDEHGTTECVVVKMDKDGNEVWRKTLGRTDNINDEAVSVVQNPNGSYSVLCNSIDKNNNSAPVYRYYLSTMTAPVP